MCDGTYTGRETSRNKARDVVDCRRSDEQMDGWIEDGRMDAQFVGALLMQYTETKHTLFSVAH